MWTMLSGGSTAWAMELHGQWSRLLVMKLSTYEIVLGGGGGREGGEACVAGGVDDPCSTSFICLKK